MSLDAIKQVTETEELSRLRKQEALQAAKRLIAETERDGQAHLEASRTEAEAKVKAMMAKAEADAADKAQLIRADTGRDCQDLRSLAEVRLERAVELIVRKVVDIR